MNNMTEHSKEDGYDMKPSRIPTFVAHLEVLGKLAVYCQISLVFDKSIDSFIMCDGEPKSDIGTTR